MRKGNVEFHWSPTNKKFELVSILEENLNEPLQTRKTFVIAFFDKASEGYNMRTVGSRFFMDKDAWIVGKHAINFLQDLFDEEEEG